MRRLGVLAAAIAACGPTAEPDPAASPPEVPAPIIARDLDPRPGYVHVELVAKAGAHAYLDGKPAAIWGYADGDGAAAVPGPRIEAELGDQIVVGLTNQLDVATTVHWHGLQLPAAADGTAVTQDPVPAGARYEARFTATHAGTFWYHPHVDADVQIERGLYGTLIVREAAAVSADADATFVLDDVKLDGSGALAEATDELDLMLGRQGNVVLVNGARRATHTVRRGAIERWRFVNAANGRYFSLRLPGQRFRVIAWDGGLLDAPYDADTLLIAPGERYEVLVTPLADGADATTLWTDHYDRGHDIPDPGPIALFDVRASSAPELPARALPMTTSAAPFTGVTVTATTAVRPMVLREIDDDAGLRFSINDEVWPFNTHVHVRQSQVEIWELDNQTEMDHPFHVHGMFFQVLSVNGAPPAHAGWKDTMNVPQMSKLRFAVRYTPLGMWMFHCHILEHAERGMMGDLMIEP